MAEEIEGTGIRWTNSEHSLSRAFLHAFAENENDRLIHHLLEKGADFNEVGADGRTPLIIALERRDRGGVHLLLDHDPDVNLVETDREHTPLMLAAKEGYLEFVDHFLSAGADADVLTSSGKR